MANHTVMPLDTLVISISPHMLRGVQQHTQSRKLMTIINRLPRRVLALTLNRAAVAAGESYIRNVDAILQGHTANQIWRLFLQPIIIGDVSAINRVSGL